MGYPDQAGKFYPDDIERRYLIDKWCDFYTSFFRPSFIKEFDVKFGCLSPSGKRERSDEENNMIERAREHQVKAMKQLETQLNASGGKFILGDELTLADYVLFEEMQDLKVFSESSLKFTDYPRAQQYEADILTASVGLNEIHQEGSPFNSEILPAFQGMMR